MDDRLGPDTQAFPAPQPRPAGWVLGGRYRVLRRIGTGGMAEVFRARDELLNRDVAVKVFRAPVDEPGNVLSTERRELELRALAQLSHPNLITLFDGAITDSDPAFLVMELIDGPNLAEQILAGPLGEPQVREIGAQVADALAYVHARGMVHRDVKPANILLGRDRSASEPEGLRACLSDFGIVRMIDNAGLTSIAVTLGTASYLAPEQARGANVDPAADVYSLGLVLIEALTGVRSFAGPQHEAMAARLVRAPDIPLGLPQPWPGLLAAMTAADPDARPTAAQVTRSLRGSADVLLPSRAVPLAGPAGLVGLGAGNPTGAVTAAATTPDSTQVLAPVPTDVPSADDVAAPHRLRSLPVAIAAFAVVALVAVAGYLIIRPSAHQTSPGSDVTSGSSGSLSADATTTGASQSAPGPGVGGTGSAASTATSTRATTSGTATSGAATSGAATFTQATSSSARPSSSATSSAPSTTPSTSASGSSSAAPSSTGAQSGSATGSKLAGGSGLAGSGTTVGSPTVTPGASP